MIFTPCEREKIEVEKLKVGMVVEVNGEEMGRTWGGGHVWRGVIGEISRGVIYLHQSAINGGVGHANPNNYGLAYSYMFNMDARPGFVLIGHKEAKKAAKKSKLPKVEYLKEHSIYDFARGLKKYGSEIAPDTKRVRYRAEVPCDISAKVVEILSPYVWFGGRRPDVDAAGQYVTEGGRKFKVGKWVQKKMKEQGIPGADKCLEEYAELMKKNATDGTMTVTNKVTDCLLASDMEEGAWGSCQAWDDGSRPMANVIYYLNEGNYVAQVENKKGFKTWRAWITRADVYLADGTKTEGYILGRQYPQPKSYYETAMKLFCERVLGWPSFYEVKSPAMSGANTLSGLIRFVNINVEAHGKTIAIPHYDIVRNHSISLMLERDPAIPIERLDVIFKHRKSVCRDCGKEKNIGTQMNLDGSCKTCGEDGHHAGGHGAPCENCGMPNDTDGDYCAECAGDMVECEECGHTEHINRTTEVLYDGNALVRLCSDCVDSIVCPRTEHHCHRESAEDCKNCILLHKHAEADAEEGEDLETAKAAL